MPYNSPKKQGIVPFTLHHRWGGSLDETEVWRSPSGTDYRLRLRELGLAMDGGGTDGNLTLRAYDGSPSTGTELESVTGGSHELSLSATTTGGNPMTLSIQNDSAGVAVASVWLVVEVV